MGEDAVERPRDAFEIERVHERAGVADLALSAAAQEPVKLLLDGTVAPRRHLLQLPKPVEIVVRPKDLRDPRRAERAYQLLLQVGLAYEEAEPLHVRARELVAKTSALEGSTKHALLASIAQAREPRTLSSTPELLEKGSNAVRASESNDADARGRKLNAAPLGERFDCDLVTFTFDDHDGAYFGPVGCHITRKRARS
jgi:hypothetical protein